MLLSLLSCVLIDFDAGDPAAALDQRVRDPPGRTPKLEDAFVGADEPHRDGAHVGR